MCFVYWFKEKSKAFFSAGVPLTYHHYNNSAISVENLAINFLTIPFRASNSYTYRKTGFNPYKTLTQVFTNKYTATYEKDETVTYPTYDNNTVTGTKTAGTLKVRAMTMDDINGATRLSSISDATSLRDAQYQKLFDLGVFYWLASTLHEDSLWFVNSNGGTYCNSIIEYGIRPVVSLKSNAKTKGIDLEGIQQLEI